MAAQVLSTITRKLFTPPSPHPKILFLHGFTRSGAAFSAQTAKLQSSLKCSLPPSTRFHFLNGTIRLDPASSFEATDSTYAWWRKDDITGRYVGLEDTMRFLGNYLDFHGPFDGVIGFSQGACLAAMLAGALERLKSGSQVAEVMRTEHPRLGFVVAISGFRPSGVWYDGLFFEGGIETPVLSVIGRADEIVTPDRSEGLVKECKRPEVLWHEGAHVVPRDPETVEKIVSFVKMHVKEMEEREEEGKKMEGGGG